MIASVIAHNIGSIVACYVIVMGTFAVAAWRTIARGRRVTAGLRDEDKPWT